jgi:hypothetical protein
MNRIARKSTILLLSIVVLLVRPSQAQNSGSIQGTVADAQGGRIAGATVRATDQGKGLVVRETTTAADGSFLLQPLDPGTYTIRISATGMKDRENTHIVLDSRQVLSLGELRMALGPAIESVTVEATLPFTETATADHAAVIDSRQVTEISMNGRDFQSLVRTLPGVVSNDSSDFRLAFNNTDSFHVDGLRGSNNNVYLDGAINTDVGANDGQFTQLSMDAVGEFKLQTSNFAAEYGRNPGVLLAINTKTGTQQFHGTVYEFHREDGFDANQFFNKVNPNGIAKPNGPVPNSKLRFNQYGFNVGGPIPVPKLSPWSDKKMFFFFNFEGTRAGRPSGGNTTYNMPNPAMLGIGTPNGQADFTSALKSSDMCANGFPAGGTCPAGQGPIGFKVGQLFVPGSITYNNQQQITGGTPYQTNGLNNVIGSSQFSGQYAAFVSFLKPFYTARAFQDPSNPANFIIPFQDSYHFNKHQEVVRYDWNINAKTNFFFRWVDDSQRESQQFGIFSTNTIPALPQFRKKPGSSWSWNLVNVISPSITNEFVFGYNHLTQVVDVDTTPQNYDKTLLGFTYRDLYTAPNIRNLRPSFNAASNLNTQPFPSGWTSEARAFTWTDNLSKIAGSHAIKTGVFFDYNQAGQQPSWTEPVSFNFTAGGPTFVLDTNNGVANLLLGNYRSVSQSNGVFFGAFRFHQLEIYGQDSWKVSRKLTLDYGLRWAYIGPTATVKPFLENYFDPNAYDPAQAVTIDTRATNPRDPGGAIQNGAICTASQPNPCPGVTNFGNPYNGLISEGKGIPPGFVDHRYNNFQPRVGFAYDPWGNGKMAIRGGFGIFHERIRQNVNSFDALGNPPLSYTPVIFNGNIRDVGPSLVSQGALVPVSLRTPARYGKIPTLYSWSIGVQRELPWRLGLDVAYVGNQARHLQYIYDLNQFPVGGTTGGLTAPPTNTWLAVAPFRGYTNVNYTDYGANSQYNALQVRVSRRFSRGLTLSTDYTYSKNTDLSDSDDTFSSVRDRFNPKLDYGPTGWDRPHVFNFNYVYDFPDFRNHGALLRYVLGGWESSGVIRAWSGTPFTLTCGGTSGTGAGGAGGSRAPSCDFVGGGPIYAPDMTDPNTGSRIQWINPFVFAQPQQGTLGNTTRNEFRGPGYQNWNLSLFKNFNIAEGKRLQLRLETFNTFNHVQFAGVNTGIGTPGAGQIPTFKPDGSGTVGNAGKISSARDPRQIQLGAKFSF